jgi:hypothetical protein
MHSISWEWCTRIRAWGGLGLKDLKYQGVALAIKWIAKAGEGEEPWKVLIRNNLRLSHCSRPRGWKYFCFTDSLTVDAPLVVQGSNVFRSIWKAWKFVKNFLINNVPVEKSGLLCRKKSIWWNLSHGGKKLALLQGCSAKKWSELGISMFGDIIMEDSIVEWEWLEDKYNLPKSQWRTYSVLRGALLNLGPIKGCCDVSCCSFQLLWPDNTPLHLGNSKYLYQLLTNKNDIFV